MADTETLTEGSDTIAAFACPRCGLDTVAEFYGPCAQCVESLRAGARKAGATETRNAVTVRRWRTYAPRRVVWWDCDTGRTDDGRDIGGGLAGELAGVLDDAGGDVVAVCGAGAGPWIAAAAAVMPDGWEPGSHYLAGVGSALRWRRGDQAVTIVDAAGWGAVGVTPAQAAEGWRAGIEYVRAAAGEPSWVPIGSPATAGRDLALRLLPRHREFPTVTPELADLIRSTTGQGRSQICAAGEIVDELHELDMRTAYGAVAWGLVGGEVCRHSGAPPATWDGGRLHGRYYVRWRAPDGWAHPGILSARGDDGITWPAEGEGWADGAEVDLARRWGWTVDVVEGMTWEPTKEVGDPLRRWAEALTTASASAERAGKIGQLSVQVAGVARGFARSMLVAGIGAMWGAPMRVTRSVPVDRAGEVPAGVAVELAGDRITWTETTEPAWPEMIHPEWAAQIWARTRCRLLDAPTAERGVRGGALHVPPGSVVGFRTDALYLSEMPVWPDDGAAGRFRLKRSAAGPLTVPASLHELDRLWNEAPPAAASIAAARTALTRGGRL